MKTDHMPSVATWLPMGRTEACQGGKGWLQVTQLARSRSLCGAGPGACTGSWLLVRETMAFIGWCKSGQIFNFYD
jgi:hypothetical protein